MSPTKSTPELSREDFEQALNSMRTLVDIRVDDLMTLAHRATQFAARRNCASRRISEVMTQPLRTVHGDSALAAAAQILISERISGLPVCDADGRLCGIITEADFLRALGFPAHQPNHNLWQTLDAWVHHITRHAGLEAPDSPVADWMTHHVVTAGPDQDLHGVIGLMKAHAVKRVVVCGAQQEPLGIVTRSDLMREFFSRFVQSGTPPDEHPATGPKDDPPRRFRDGPPDPGS